MARLNILAFAFLPLSWVAVSLIFLTMTTEYALSGIFCQSIFGMTQFSISAVWYPLWGFVVLVVLILVSLVLPKNDFCHYITGTSAPNWMRRMGLLPSTKDGIHHSSEDTLLFACPAPRLDRQIYDLAPATWMRGIPSSPIYRLPAVDFLPGRPIS